MRWRTLAPAAITTLLLAQPLRAQVSVQGIDVHGYGGWGYGRTTDNLNSNMFLVGHSRGDYSHVELALNLASQVNERVTITVQPFWHSGHHANQTSSGIDFAFGEYKFSDLARLRVGAVKQPFGIYTELFDVGTVRPFAGLPQGVYGPSGAVGKAYSGMGLTGSSYMESGWGLTYDIYGGGLEVLENDVPLQVLREGADTTGKTLNFATTRALRDVVGGRLTVHAPVEGLSVGGSAYTATRPVGTTEVRRTVYGTHLEYVADRVSLRTEWMREDEPDRQTQVDGSYIEGAYFLSAGWQVAGLYSTSKTSLDGIDVSRAPSLLDHEEWGLGLNYWFAPNFVVKASYHAVEGNRFASPDPTRLRAVVATNGLFETTNVVLVGGQFSF
jgi:hypothetical protein